MDERSWVRRHVVDVLAGRLGHSLDISAVRKLAYANEIRRYIGDDPDATAVKYETDILVTERIGEEGWKPRLVIEAKLARVSTHDAITYSEKAFHHKKVHPYLRYGILIGDRKHYPLPGRLFRHGAYFDFMFSWVGLEATTSEMSTLTELIQNEVQASRDLEDILYTSRKPGRNRYTLLHKPLVLR